ncbi:hypothetical protein Pmar_PMAR009001, partial [Perkinsus marinus ATCC 50983]
GESCISGAEVKLELSLPVPLLVSSIYFIMLLFLKVLTGTLAGQYVMEGTDVVPCTHHEDDGSWTSSNIRNSPGPSLATSGQQ